ncbi:MAG: hypothetical protein A3C13_04525 [Candidatus Lloydbacteria bacterium RIFCSPHIGHO2_02_FULL_50_11]|nr:MAG: hypothetical protein A3C13_04525 [Candidatus Lloydbacteria bacterium RIFCSPHIGHO2_02_FULL_50_11]
MNIHRTRLSFIIAVFLAFFAWNIAQADTSFSGTIAGDITWTKANGPYVTSGVSIPLGSSLTIEPGAIVKAAEMSNPFTVDGTLIIGRADNEPVIITSLKDDSAGGDTNGDGSTSAPQTGDWNTMVFNSWSMGTVTNTVIRYGGASPYNPWSGGSYMNPLITNNGGTLTLDHVTLSWGGNDGLTQVAGSAAITNSTFANFGRNGVTAHHSTLTVMDSNFNTLTEGISVSTGATFVVGNNTFAHISSRKAIAVDGSSIHFMSHGGNTGEGAISLGLSLEEDLVLPGDGLPYVPRYLTVPYGFTLNILPGAIIKMRPDVIIPVDGILNVGSSTSTDEVVITSITDDSLGGDTNGDGDATLPHAGEWRSIVFNPGSTGRIENARILYGGYDWLSAIKNNGGTLTLDRVELARSGNFGLLQLGGRATVVDSEIASSTRYGIWISNGTFAIHRSGIHDNPSYGLYNGSAISIDATDNYWGDPSGPTHPSNPGGTGDRVSDNVDFGNFTSCNPLATEGPDLCVSNVLFLPGIEASRLYAYDDPNCWFINCENQLWEPNRNDDVRKLYLDANGKSTAAFDIYTRDVIGEINVTGSNIYKSFSTRMDNLKSEHIINDWEAVPYDWRLSLSDILSSGKKENGNISYNKATSSPYIIQELRRLAATSKTGRVTIVAHSNGGLVAKKLTQLLGADAPKLIDKMIFVAVPQVGTPAAIAASLHGYDQDHLFGLITLNSVARTFASTSPMLYHLLPSAGYFNDVRTPVVTFDPATLSDWATRYGENINSEITLRAFLTDSYGRADSQSTDIARPIQLNDGLFSDAEVLHTNLDSWAPPPGVKLIQIAGWGVPKTVSGINYTQKTSQFCLPGAGCLPPSTSFETGMNFTIDGDGTVLIPSALWTSTSTGAINYWVNLRAYNRDHFVNTLGGFFSFDHSRILEVDGLNNFISDLLTNIKKPLSEYSYLSVETPTSTDMRLVYSLHSPLTLDLYDEKGRHTGVSTTTGQVEEQIPGTYYTEVGDAKYLFTDTNLVGKIIMNGYATGTFTFSAQELAGDTLIASTTWKDVPTMPTTSVVLNITSDIATISSMFIDEDGDGTTDITLAPKLNDTVTIPRPPSYLFSGFLQPINDTSVWPGLTSSVFKGGSTIPVRFQLKDAGGNLVQASAVPLWLPPEQVSPMNASTNEVASINTSTNGTTYRWDTADQQYIYDWSTKGLLAGYWYRISAKLDDGATYSVVVWVR